MNRSILVVLTVLILAGAGVAVLLTQGNTEPENKLPFAPVAEVDQHPWLKKNGAKSSTAEHSDHAHAESKQSRPVPAATGPHPRAEVTETVYNFGRQLLNSEPGEHEFIIRNTGEAELKLQAGAPTCQCTLFRVDKERVAPGEHASVFIQWKAERRDNAFRHGGAIYTNDPDLQEINFAVTGIIDVPVEVLPADHWDVGNVYLDRDGQIQTAFASKTLEEFEIESITAGSEFVTFDVAPMSPDMIARDNWLSGYSVTVTVSKEIPGGKFADEVRVKLSSSEQELVIPLSARKHGRIRYLPTTGTFFDPEPMLLKLGLFSAGQSRSGKLLLIVDQAGLEEPLQITNIEAEPSFLTARLEPDGPQSGEKRRYFLIVEVPAGKPRVQYSLDNLASIRVHTNHPEGEVISLDVLFSTN